jgi:hypothetical protein
MKAALPGIIVLTIILLASCKTTREACLLPEDPWSPYERSIDAAQDCDQLHTAYMAFCKRLIANDGRIDADHWKHYVKTTTFLERKMNRKARKFCHCTYFDNPWASSATFDDELSLPVEDNDLDLWEDDFDYDEFDATR